MQMQKNLHKHALPVVVMLVGLLIAGFGLLDYTNDNYAALSSDLTSKALSIKPQRNGLAEITLTQPSTALPTQPAVSTGLLAQARSTAALAEVQFSFQK